MVTELLTTPGTACQLGASKVALVLRVKPVAAGGQETVTLAPDRLMVRVAFGWATVVEGITKGMPEPEGAPKATMAASFSLPTLTWMLSTKTVASWSSPSPSANRRTVCCQ